MTARIYTADAELYDIAFDWDVSAEADWLVERLGPTCRSVLEPGCGTGRMLEALARRGLETVGLDSSEEMVGFARGRLGRAGVEAEVHLADMTDFELGRLFDGGVSVVSTVGLLTPAGFARHLEAMARHLRPGARYLVQQGIAGDQDDAWRSEWEAERDGVKLRVVWEGFGSGLARSRVGIVTGPRAGEIVEDVHTNTAWPPEAWRDAVAGSPFVQVACYDGGVAERPAVEVAGGRGFLWHELVVP